MKVFGRNVTAKRGFIIKIISHLLHILILITPDQSFQDAKQLWVIFLVHEDFLRPSRVKVGSAQEG